MKKRLVLLALLGASAACSRGADPAVAEEIAAREAFRAHTLEVEDAGRAYGVSAQPDVVFEEDFGVLQNDPMGNVRNHAFRWFGRNAHVRLRRHGNHTMWVRAKGWADVKALKTKYWVTLYVAGRLVTQSPPSDDHFWAEFKLTPDMFGDEEWVDLNVVPSTIAWHWLTPPGLTVALLYDFDYEEIP